MKTFHPEGKKFEKKEQIYIDDDKKRENAGIENSLIKKVKIKNKLLLSGKFDFDPKEMLDKSFLFDLKNQVKKK